MGWKSLLTEMPVWMIGRFYPPRHDPHRDTPREILVLRPNDFGELLTTTPIFEALRKRFPKTRLIAGVGSWGRPILENNPFIDEIVDIDAPWNNKLVEDRSPGNVLRFLRKSPQVAALRARGGFDVGIDVLGSYMGALLMMRLGVRYRIGVRGYRGGHSACHEYIDFARRQSGRAALAQAELLGATALPDARPQLFLTRKERARAAKIWKAAVPGQRTVRLLVGIGAGVPTKVWDPRQVGAALAQIARTLESTGDACDIVIVGSEADKARAAEAIAAAGPGVPVRSVAGAVPMRIVFALAEAATAVLTNSSMLMHVAAAFRRPTVAVIGGSITRPTVHDAIWGYPAHYRSVSPDHYVADQHARNWPSVERVVQSVLESLGTQRTRVGAEV
ncbi:MULTISPECIES: glycosyltransferase family 9 protein [unclassified Caballeronia]|uniref:glycosyltransferase family 9 protein n=1 Tax=unclassified Caballeronia TaxID=2646786 RepID=UPI002864E43D|nr:MULTISPECIES: glycosyltransferase family 9 protein [unclassified Caballeronia]MDR5752204.1 glycosyltransferase family 9 protein [Caballeronia sp. LZ024]MDR5841915.1 glycosyltransferase family 9 protein [Caballeronia sp. LZ031]